MTRNWIATASRSLFSARSASVGPRRSRTSPCLENLEYRLSLSSVSGGGVVSLAIQGNHIGTPAAVELRKHDPVDAIQGNHIGTA